MKPSAQRTSTEEPWSTSAGHGSATQAIEASVATNGAHSALQVLLTSSHTPLTQYTSSSDEPAGNAL